MPSAGVGISICSDPRQAAEEAAAGVLAACGAPQAALVFLSGSADPAPTIEALEAALGTHDVVGVTAEGVMGAGQESQGVHALSVLGLAGLDLHPFLVPELDREDAAEEIAAVVGPVGERDLIVLLPDPATLRAERLLPELQDRLAGAVLVGAGSVEDGTGRAHQWCGGELETGALAGLVVRGGAPARVGVTQACRPVTPVAHATKTEGNWILEIDGRPALDVYREAAGGALAGDLRRAAMFTLVAFPRSETDPLGPGSYLVRHVVGVAERERALAVPERVEAGDPIAFVHREPETARQDLKDMLERLPDAREATCGIWLDCCARGQGFFGVPGLEAAYLEQALGPVPVAGMFGSCEIGPVAGTTELLTYTGVLALVQG